MAQLDNDGQPKYVDGVYVSKPNKDFVVAKVRMKVNEFQDYINLPVVKDQIAKNSGNLNMDILISKKGNWYMPHSKFIAEKKVTTNDQNPDRQLDDYGDDNPFENS